MAESNRAPRLRWLLGDAAQRRAARRYWLKDTGIGIAKVAAHYGLRALPIDWCSAAGARLGLLARAYHPKSEARARKAWARLVPQAADPASTDAAIERLWRGVGRTMAEFSVLDRLWRAGRIEVEGIEIVERAAASGRPMLGVALHLGNWEVIPMALFALGYHGSGIYLPMENRFEHFISVAARRRYGARLVAPGPSTTRTALRALKAGESFFIYIDELNRGRVQAPSLGRTLPGEESNLAYAVRLAAMANAAVIPVYALRLGDEARFKITILPEVQLQNTGNRKADGLANIARLDAVIDPVIRQHLDQWFYVLDLESDP